MGGMRTALALLLLAGCPAEDPVGLDGEWAPTWTCASGCEEPAPSVASATMLLVDGDRAWWPGARFGDDLRIGARDGECLAVPPSDEQPTGRHRDGFDLCAVDGEIVADIRERSQDGTRAIAWRLIATR